MAVSTCGYVAAMDQMDETDPQDVAEALDEDERSDDVDDPEGLLEYPPERPLGVEEYGTTAGEERVDEPLRARVAREEPERGMHTDTTLVGRLTQPGDEDPFAVDDEAAAVADAFAEPDLSAEEAAMHLTTPPPMGDDAGDGYLDAD